MLEETFWSYTTLQARIGSNAIQEINTSIEGINSTLSDQLSLLIRIQRDVKCYIYHNPCQVCATLLAAQSWAANQRESDDGGDLPIPVPPPHYTTNDPDNGGGGHSPGRDRRGMAEELASVPSGLPSLTSDSSSSSHNYHTRDEVNNVSSLSWYVFANCFRYNFQRSGDLRSSRSSSEHRGPVAVPFSTATYRLSFPPSVTSDAVLLHQFTPIHPNESRVSLGVSDSSTRVSSNGDNPFVPFHYFSPGPFPGGYLPSTPQSPHAQPSEEEERAAALAIALEEGLQGLPQRVYGGGGGDGGVGAIGVFSQGEAQFRAL